VATDGGESETSGRRWTIVVKLAVSGGLLVYLLRLTDLERLAAALGAFDLLLVALAALVYLAGQVLSAAKWRLLAHAAGLDRPFHRFLRHYFVGMFFNVFGLGTVGGDVVRGLALAGPAGRRTLALNTVVADRVSGLLVLLAIALGSLLLFRSYDLPAVVYWTTVALSAGLLAGWRLAPAMLPLALRPEHWFRRLVERDLAQYWNDSALLVRVSAISATFHLSQIAVLAILAGALRIEVPASYFFIFGPLVNVFASLPISVNGLGVRESAYVFFLTHVGIDSASAIAFAFLWFGLVLLAGAVGGIVYLRSEGESAADRSSEAEASENRSTSL
jgi:glycosyltransferase 2 family protein